MESTRRHTIARRALWLAVAVAMALAASVGLQAATQQQAFAGQAKPKITLEGPKNVTVQKGDAFRVKAKAAKGAKVTFKSSKKSVASVSKKGKVKARKAGKATISVIAKKGKRKAVKKVKVRVVKPETAAEPQAGEPQREEPADEPAQPDPADEPGQPDPPQHNPGGTENTDPEGLGPVETYTFSYPCATKLQGIYTQSEIYEHLPTNAEISDVHVSVAFPDGTSLSCDDLYFVNGWPNGTPDNCIYIASSGAPLLGHGDGLAVFTVTYREVLG